MYEAVIFVAGIATGVAFKEQILGFRTRAKKAADAAVKAYKGN